MDIFLSKTSMKEAEPKKENSEPGKDKFDPNKVQTGNVPKTVKNGDTSNKEAKNEKGEPKPCQNKELPAFDPNKFRAGYVPKAVMKGEYVYTIVYTGVKDTGLWEVLGQHREQEETLQALRDATAWQE